MKRRVYSEKIVCFHNEFIFCEIKTDQIRSFVKSLIHQYVSKNCNLLVFECCTCDFITNKIIIKE